MTIDVLFIHSAGAQTGLEGSTPFVQCLRQNLGPNYQVEFPLMPDPDEPNYDKWKQKLEQIFSGKSFPIIIGHSLGGSVLLKYISEQKPKMSAMGLFLVATPYWGNEDWDVAEFVLRDDFASRLPANLNIHLYQSRNDDVVPGAHLSRYAAAIPHAMVRMVDGAGHLFKEGLPELVNDIRQLTNNG